MLAQYYFRLSFKHAIAAIVVFTAIGAATVGFVATLGPRTGLRTMVIYRPSLQALIPSIIGRMLIPLRSSRATRSATSVALPSPSSTSSPSSVSLLPPSSSVVRPSTGSRANFRSSSASSSWACAPSSSASSGTRFFTSTSACPQLPGVMPDETVATSDTHGSWCSLFTA